LRWVNNGNPIRPDKSSEQNFRESFSILHSRFGRGMRGHLTNNQPRKSLRLSIQIMLPRHAIIPESRRKEHERAAAGEVDQKRRWQHEPGRNRCTRRQRAAQVTVERTRACTLGAFVEEQLDGTCVTGQSFGAITRTHNTRSVRILNTVGAQGASAAGTNGNRVHRIVLEAFHLTR